MLTITPRAAVAVKNVYDPEFLGLRIIVSSSGCSGLSYRMGLETEIEAEDKVIEVEGVKVLVDPNSAQLLTGATMDFVESYEGTGFVFDNPNVKSCSCSSKSC